MPKTKSRTRKTEEKLKAGLPDDTSSAADAAKSKKVGNGG
jgi:hypothetical protein